MRKEIYKYGGLLGVLLLVLPFGLSAQEEQKSVQKQYTVSAETLLSIENQFGNIVLHPWDKKEVKVDVSILVKHANARQAAEMLDGIRIQEERAGNEIRLRTTLHNVKTKGNSSMRINYEVYAPANIRLKLANKFGDIVLPDLQGDTEIRLGFGKLEAGRFEGNNNRLMIEFSDASATGNIRNLQGEFRFSKIALGALTGQAGISAQHCGRFELGAARGLQDLELNAEYTDLQLDLADNFSGGFDVSTNFGEFRYGSKVEARETAGGDQNRGPRFKFHYEGKIGDGGSAMLRIRSSFSTISFR